MVIQHGPYIDPVEYLPAQMRLQDIPRPTMNGVTLSAKSFTLMTMDFPLLMAGERMRGFFGAGNVRASEETHASFHADVNAVCAKAGLPTF